MTQPNKKFKKKVVFRPAYDKRHTDPSKNYGIHGVDVAFYLIGEKGAIQFVLYSGWNLPHVKAEFKHNEFFRDNFPMAADIGYHSPIPMFEDQNPMRDKCHILKTKCYYDGSALMAEEYLQILIAKGSIGLWKAMKEVYRDRFERAGE